MSAVVIGIGNEFRHDDAIGLRLITELVVIVDAVLCGPARPDPPHRSERVAPGHWRAQLTRPGRARRG